MTVKIGVISPTQLTSEVVDAAFEDRWPEAKHLSIIDEALYEALGAERVPPAGCVQRIRRLMELSVESGVQAIAFTGSVFGPAVIEARKTIPVPVLTSFEAMIEEGLALGSRLYLLSTAPEAVTALAADVRQAAARSDRSYEIRERSLPDALDALYRDGDRARQDRLIAEAVAEVSDVDAILLGQFTMGSVLRLVGDRSPPVLAPAYSMVSHFKRRFSHV